MYGVHGALQPGGIKLDLAYYALSLTEAEDNSLIAGDATYNVLVASGKIAGNYTVGAEYLFSDVKNNDMTSDKNGMALYVKAKLNKTWGLRYYYFDIGVASVAERGIYSQDDFPHSSNFTLYVFGSI